MIIESCHILSFGKLQDLRLTFDPACNVIVGENESGKSTLAAFLHYMLYGFSGKRTGSLTDRERYISWQTGKAGGEMVFSAGGGRYRAERRTETVGQDSTGRPTYREHSAIFDLASGAPVFGRNAAGTVFLGVEEDVFARTAFFDQVAPARPDDGEMKEKLENILFSGDETVSTRKALTRLDEARRSLLHKNGKGGVLYELEKQREELCANLVEVDATKEALLEKEALLNDTRHRREEAEKEAAKFTRLESDYRNAALIRTYDRLHELESAKEALQKEQESFEEENKVDGFLPGGEYLTRLAVARQAVQDAYRTMAESTNQIRILSAKEELISEAEKKIPAVDAVGGENAVREVYTDALAHSRRLLGLAAGGIALAVCFFVLAVLSVPVFRLLPLLFVFAVAGAALAAGGAFCLWRRQRWQSDAAALAETFGARSREELGEVLSQITEARVRSENRRHRKENAAAQRDKSADRYREALEGLRRTAGEWGCDLPNDAAGREAALEGLVTRVTAFMAEQTRLRERVVSADASVRELRQQLNGKDEVSVRATVAPADRDKLKNINYEDLEKGKEHYTHQVEYYRAKQAELEKELIFYRAKVAEPAALAEQIQQIDARREGLQAKYDAYCMAMEAIAQAKDRLRRGVSPFLADYARGMVAECTGGKYTELGVGEGLQLSLREGEDLTRPVETLSAGTRDGAYFAMRMALVALLYREAPPLFFDELLARQDENRRAGIFAGLHRLVGEGRQCFLFTCRVEDAAAAERALAPRLFSLPQPDAAGQTAQPGEKEKTEGERV